MLTTSSETESTGQVPAVENAESNGRSPAIYLNNLVTDVTFFSKNEKDIVFEYYMEADATLSLHGWILKNKNGSKDQFNPKPDIILQSTGNSGVGIGSGTYLCNQVLYQKYVKAIIDYLKDNKIEKAELRFSPTSDSGGVIFYTVTIHRLDGNQTTTDSPSFPTNPSPPHSNFE